MTSEVTVAVWNGALLRLGATPLTGPDDDSETAARVRMLWPLVRQDLLRAYPWNCAMRRALLARNAVAPAWGFAHAYPVPADCMLVWEVNGQRQDSGAWSVEGAQILTDLAPPLRMRYVADVEAHQMDATVRSLLSRVLAEALAQAQTNNTALAERLGREAARAMVEAKGVDARESNHHRPYDRDDMADWLSVRA